MNYATFFCGAEFIYFELDPNKLQTIADAIKCVQSKLGFKFTDRSRVTKDKVILSFDHVVKPGEQYVCVSLPESYG